MKSIIALLNPSRTYFHPSMTGGCTARLAVFAHTFVRELCRIIGWQRGYVYSGVPEEGVVYWRPSISRVDLLTVTEYLLPLLQMGVYSKDRSVAQYSNTSIKVTITLINTN